MGVDNISSIQTFDFSQAAKYQENVINADEIKSILYLGIRGNPFRKVIENMSADPSHTVDTFV